MSTEFDGEKFLRLMSIKKSLGNGSAKYPYQGTIYGQPSETIVKANAIRGYLDTLEIRDYIFHDPKTNREFPIDYIIHDSAKDKIPYLEISEEAYARLQKILNENKAARGV